MQHAVHPIPRNRHRLHALATIAGLFALGGCGGTPSTATAPPRPHDRVALALSCPDPAFADAIEPMVRSWEVRTGAKVTLARTAMTPTDATDLAVIPAGHLGAWAEPGHLAAVPAKYRGGEHPIQWFGFLNAYGDRLVEWGARTQAIPLAGDGFVLVYRADRFNDKAAVADFFIQFKRPLGPPTTWEAFAEVAAFFAARDKKPSLPPLPADAERTFDLFARVASSLDRPALSDKDLDGPNKDAERLAFLFAVKDGAPRLRAPGFTAAAEWLAGLHATGCLPAGAGSDDPAAALAENRAVLALMSLDQLAKLPRENGAVPTRFGLAGVPGARRYFDPARGAWAEAAGQGGNYVPHFSGGRLGVVRARCPHQEAAFELLAEIGGPERGAELVSTPGLGAGPTRVAHLDPNRLLPWLGYGFDETHSKDLQEALRQYVGQPVKNPTYGLRGPDRADLALAAGGALRKLGTGAKPGDALAEAMTAWTAIDTKTPAATLRVWRQRAAGLN